MDKILDLEALKGMPMTAEFASILFGVSNFTNITTQVGVDFVTYVLRDWGVGGEQIRISVYGDIKRMELNSISGCSLTVKSAFQIVRYIDNYLVSVKNKNEWNTQLVEDGMNRLIGSMTGKIELKKDIDYGRVKTIVEDESGVIFEKCKYCPIESYKFVSTEYYPIGSCKHIDGSTNTEPIKRVAWLDTALGNGYSIRSILESDEYFYYNGSRLKVLKK